MLKSLARMPAMPRCEQFAIRRGEPWRTVRYALESALRIEWRRRCVRECLTLGRTRAAVRHSKGLKHGGLFAALLSPPYGLGYGVSRVLGRSRLRNNATKTPSIRPATPPRPIISAFFGLTAESGSSAGWSSRTSCSVLVSNLIPLS